MQEPALEARRITKRYPGVLALNAVSFSLAPAEVHALCGENGAGKSTLIKVLGGVIPTSGHEGELLVGGRAVTFQSTADAERAGIAVIHQELALVDGLSVAENIFLGHEPGAALWIDRTRMLRDAERALARFQLDIDPRARLGTLGLGQKQLVEIARALTKNAKILIFDEPTSALSQREVDTLLRIIKELRQEGVSSIYISHKLEEVFDLCDRITVLRDGQSISTTERSAATSADIVQAMVGRRLEELFPPRARSFGDTVLAVKDLGVSAERGQPERLSGLSFSVRAGEVLGIGGLMGAGRSELLMHLFGCYGVRSTGNVHFLGQPVPPRSAKEHVAAGLVLVTEDRKRYGLSLGAGVGFNLSLSALPKLSPRGWINRRQEALRIAELIQRLAVKAASTDVAVGTLSGGNQQKVVLGRALMTEPRLILLDEPTRGVDIGAKQEIYQLIRELSDQGLGVILVSSELPELLGLADRILMLKQGRPGGIFEAGAVSQEQLLAAAM
jgi:D-xylose transport system ATP-binding protein